MRRWSRSVAVGRLHLPSHRTTTAHLCSAYPFVAEAGIGTDGVYLGTNVLTGSGGFWFDPFDAYRAGVVTNPNIVVVGEPGMGKSTAVKTFIHRTVGVLGRWVAITDPKGEYRLLAEQLDLQVIDIHPGGVSRLNPIDIGAVGDDQGDVARRRAVMLAALLTSVLHRELTPLEDAALGWIANELTTVHRPTLQDVAHLLADPTEAMVEAAGRPCYELAREVDALRFALGKLLDRSLRGMFDGQSTVDVDWSRRGVVIDLSSVHHEPDALSAVMVATTAWLQGVLRRPEGTPRLQVLDEAWSLLSSERTSRYLQACWKLGRAYGIANLAVIHRLSDLRSQADDGTATAKVAMGLLADTQTRVLFRQSSDQLADARSLLGLNHKEVEVLGRLSRGRALWKVGDRTAVVAHHVAPGEQSLCDTDARMAARRTSEGRP